MDSNKRIPKHVSIIMDGNGRWATARGMSRSQGHAEGVESIRACLQAAIESGVEYLSLYAFSEENWNRSEQEVMGLMELFFTGMKSELQLFLDTHVRFLMLGNRPRLSEKLNKAIDEMEGITGQTYDKLYIVGGGAKNRYLNRLTEEATGKQVIALPIEATALGNLKIQTEEETT